MLDYAQRSAVGPAASGHPGEASSIPGSITGLGLRALMGRLAGKGQSGLPAAGRGFAAAPEFPEPRDDRLDPALRARAQAAFRTVDGAAERALDAALAVMEAEIVALRDVVRGYGEALKSVQTYAAEDAVRRTAGAALRARPQRLAAAGPVPKLAQDGVLLGTLRHG